MRVSVTASPHHDSHETSSGARMIIHYGYPATPHHHRSVVVDDVDVTARVRHLFIDLRSHRSVAILANPAEIIVADSVHVDVAAPDEDGDGVVSFTTIN